MVFQLRIRLGDGLQRYGHVVVLEILEHQHGVVPLLLGLDLVPVGKTGKALLHIEIGELEIQIRRVEFLVHLIVQQLGYFFVQHCMRFLSAADETSLFVLSNHYITDCRKCNGSREKSGGRAGGAVLQWACCKVPFWENFNGNQTAGAAFLQTGGPIRVIMVLLSTGGF